MGKLTGFIEPVNKEPFNPVMAHAAGIAGKVETFWKRVSTPEAGSKGLELELCKLCCFIQEDYIIFLALILEDISFPVTVAEADA